MCAAPVPINGKNRVAPSEREGRFFNLFSAA